MIDIVQWWVLVGENPLMAAAVFGIDSDGLPRRWVPGEGMVDWPSLAEYTVGGEPGARQIDEATARRLILRGVGHVAPEIVDRNRGDAPTLRVLRVSYTTPR